MEFNTTLPFISELFGVDSGVISSWINEGMPVEPDQSIDLRKCIQWKLSHSNNEKIYLTREKVAALLGYQSESINRFERENDLPKESYNTYDLEKVIRWFAAYLKDKFEKELKRITAAGPQEELMLVNKDLKLLQYKQKIGELVLKDDVKNEWLSEMKRINQALEIFPNKVLTHLKYAKDEFEMRDILEKEIEEMLIKMSELPSIRIADQKMNNHKRPELVP